MITSLLRVAFLLSIPLITLLIFNTLTAHGLKKNILSLPSQLGQTRLQNKKEEYGKQ